MLIRNADIWRVGHGDVRIADGRIAAIGRLDPREGEPLIDARGGALLPGLHDHHIHLTALAARQASILCGPPEVSHAEALAARLSTPGEGWLRGIGYHESVAGMLNRAMLDAMVAERPVRIQHRSGRMWFLNSRAMDALLNKAAAPPGLDRATGQLFDEDSWLRQALGSTPPSLAEASAALAGYGVTGITDMSPANDPAMADHFAREQAGGALVQRCLMAGRLSLKQATAGPMLRAGIAKLHLHENALPDLDDSIAFVRAAHGQGWPVAVHCATETELVFALAAIEEAGVLPGDRIEHGSVLPEPLADELTRLQLRVVVQPHFIAERGDQYLRDVEPRDIPCLYRLRSLAEAGVVLAGGSDAPFGDADPWTAMRAAMSRQTREGVVMGGQEALTPEAALALFLADAEDLPIERRIAPGAPADLCLLDRPWNQARDRLLADNVRATLVGGAIIHDRVDQAPVERGLRADALA
jgi:predicted amidohydrolase YtcJ